MFKKAFVVALVLLGSCRFFDDPDGPKKVNFMIIANVEAPDMGGRIRPIDDAQVTITAFVDGETWQLDSRIIANGILRIGFYLHQTDFIRAKEMLLTIEKEDHDIFVRSIKHAEFKGEPRQVKVAELGTLLLKPTEPVR